MPVSRWANWCWCTTNPARGVAESSLPQRPEFATVQWPRALIGTRNLESPGEFAQRILLGTRRVSAGNFLQDGQQVLAKFSRILAHGEMAVVFHHRELRTFHAGRQLASFIGPSGKIVLAG